MSLRSLIEQLRLEKKGSVRALKYPSDCKQKALFKAAKSKADIKHGGNHDTVVDKVTGQVITQIPRHDPTSGTCRAIIKKLKKALL
jgi:hypothetical protein